MQVVIIGAGVSGLSIGAALVKAGAQVTIFEKSGSIAGLATSFARNGFVFDLGPHMFFGKKVNPELKAFFDAEKIIIENKGLKRGIYIHNRFFSYPLKPGEMFKSIQKRRWPRIFFELVAANLRRKDDYQTVEQWVKGKIGKTLFNYIELDAYVRKLYGISAAETSADWGKHRLKPLGNFDLWNAAKATLSPWAPKKRRYIYYPPDGIGEIPRHLSEYVSSHGGKILLNTPVKTIVTSNGRVQELRIKKNGREKSVSADFVVSTGRIRDLVRLIEPKPQATVAASADALKYRDLIIVYLMIRKPKAFRHCFVYFSTQETLFKRVTEFKHFSPKMAPADCTSLAVEICVDPDDEKLGYDEKQLFEIVINEMEALDIVKRQEVMDFFVMKIPAVYPVYFLNYQRHLKCLLEYLSGTSNLVSIGRGGLYQHDNMPTAIQSALDTGRLILHHARQDAAMINQVVYKGRVDKYRNIY